MRACAVYLQLLLAIAIVTASWSAFASGRMAPADTTYVNAVGQVRLHLDLAADNITEAPQTSSNHLREAWSLYNQTLGVEGKLISPETNQRLQSDFGAALSATLSSEQTVFLIQSQLVKKGMLELAWRGTWYYLTAEIDPHAAHAWYLVLAEKFDWREDDPTGQVMTSIIEDHQVTNDRRSQLKDLILGTFADKVREETLEAEAILATSQEKARVKAAEALAYYYTIADDLEAKLGEEDRVVIESWLQLLQMYTRDGYHLGVAVARDRILRVLAEYEGIEGISEIRQIIQALTFALEEYRAAVSETGDVLDESELQEAIQFVSLATTLWNRSRSRALVLAPSVASEVDQGLRQLASLVAERAPPSEVESVVQGLLQALDSIAGAEASGELSALRHLTLLQENLTVALETYKAGNVEEAETIVATAYLEHFEPIEETLDQANQRLREDLESAINIDLRGLIQARADPTTVEAKVSEIQGMILQMEASLTSPAVVREINVGLLAALLAVITLEAVVILYLHARERALRRRIMEPEESA